MTKAQYKAKKRRELLETVEGFAVVFGIFASAYLVILTAQLFK